MWVADILTSIFTKLEYGLVSKQDAPYPDLNCNIESENVVPTTFPTLYLQELPPVETGQDLDNIDTPFVIYTVQMNVWARSEQECKDISYSAITEMKKMRFNTTAFPDIQTRDNVSYGVIRMRRTIGDGDSL